MAHSLTFKNYARLTQGDSTVPLTPANNGVTDPVLSVNTDSKIVATIAPLAAIITKQENATVLLNGANRREDRQHDEIRMRVPTHNLMLLVGASSRGSQQSQLGSMDIRGPGSA